MPHRCRSEVALTVHPLQNKGIARNIIIYLLSPKKASEGARAFRGSFTAVVLLLYLSCEFVHGSNRQMYNLRAYQYREHKRFLATSPTSHNLHKLHACLATRPPHHCSSSDQASLVLMRPLFIRAFDPAPLLRRSTAVYCPSNARLTSLHYDVSLPLGTRYSVSF